MTMNYKKPHLDISNQMALGADRETIDREQLASTSWQLYGNVSPLISYENRVGLASGTTRFGLPRTLIDTPSPGYNPAAGEKSMELMEQILNTMGCSNVMSKTYPQRGDHAACTTRMSTTPELGVVNPQHQIFGIDNIYVLGNSVLPTLAAANPTLTLLAMTYRLLDNLAL